MNDQPSTFIPPRLAVFILTRRIPAEHREYVVGDLNERFEEKAQTEGIRKARLWYWREAFIALLTRWEMQARRHDAAVYGDGLMQTMLQDLRWALKVFRTSRASAIAVVLTLGLAIGANTTIFSWINRALLDPLPGIDTNGLVEFGTTSPMGDFSLSYPDYSDFRQRSKTIALAGREQQALNLTGHDGVERVWGEIVSDNYFDVLGVRPVLGRGFIEADMKEGAPLVTVLAHSMWQRKFAGDPEIIGRNVPINGRQFAVVGIAPEGFVGADMGLKLDVFVPMSAVETIMAGGNRLGRRGTHWFEGIARLRPGVTLEQARSEMPAVALGMVDIVPEYKGLTISLTPIRESKNGGIPVLRPVLYAMMTVVGLILLIACANIANLLLARASSRRREIAIRLSMGATRSRLMRQLLTEGLVLAAAGAAVALIITRFTAGLLTRFAPPSDLPIVMQVNLDWRVYVFTVGITIAATLLFAVMPAFRLSAAGSSEAMKEGSSAAGTRNRLRSTLVVVQVALSLALLVAAGLCMVSLKRIEAFNPGFRKDGVLLASLDLFPARYEPAKGTQVLNNVLDALQTIPGVTSYTLARHVPLGFSGLSSSSIEVEGRQTEPNRPDIVSFTTVGPNYLGVMDIPLIAGRDLMRSDQRGAAPVAVVSETMAKQFWPSKDAVGARFRFGSNSDWITVVGVAGDVKWREVKENSRRFVYLPVLQSFQPGTVIHVRTAGDPALLASAVRDAVAKVVPELPVFSIRTLSGHVSASTFQQSMASTLLAAFGALALILAALGLYGVLAFVVSQRTREIGIRIAVGAKPDDVFRMIVRQGLTLTIIGVVLGIAAAYGLGSAMSSLLFGVSASDPLILGAGSALMLLTALAACLIPAKRAIAVDPVASLRCE